MTHNLDISGRSEFMSDGVVVLYPVGDRVLGASLTRVLTFSFFGFSVYFSSDNMMF